MPKRAFIASIIKVTGNVNADIGIGTRIPLKKILTWNQETKVFVSARCVRRCIRERLMEKGFSIDPLQLIGTEATQQLGDVGDPIEYVDDDLFGYLVPENVPRRRDSPIKVSHLISLKHTEIKPEFAARFPREFLKEFKSGYPAPFEIELAEWLGRLEVIVSNRIGRFSLDELGKELVSKHQDKLEEKEKLYYLSNKERSRRLKAFLEVLLWEGWCFPRGAQSPSVPEFHYAVIALSKHITPIFSYVTIDEDGKLLRSIMGGIEKLYGALIDHLFVLDYRASKFEALTRKDNTLEVNESGELNATKISEIIGKICDYIILESR